jgi:hypothetical protein
MSVFVKPKLMRIDRPNFMRNLVKREKELQLNFQKHTRHFNEKNHSFIKVYTIHDAFNEDNEEKYYGK